ncbi:unnamed protein product, partial [Ostreobium quekettii]
DCPLTLYIHAAGPRLSRPTAVCRPGPFCGFLFFFPFWQRGDLLGRLRARVEDPGGAASGFGDWQIEIPIDRQRREEEVRMNGGAPEGEKQMAGIATDVAGPGHDRQEAEEEGQEDGTSESGGQDEGSPPDIFVCPISREIMRDPVVLVETGQVYDRHSIAEWFRMNHSTCPLTGTVLTSQRLTPLYTIRAAIHDWASAQGISLEREAPPTGRPASPGGGCLPDDAATPAQSLDQYGPLDDACHCLPIVSAQSVSAYDVSGLFRLVQEQRMPQSYAALVLLREMTRHIDTMRLKKVRKEIQVDVLRVLLRHTQLQVPAARLLVQMKGTLRMQELLPLLKMNDMDLRREVLTRVFEHGFRYRGKMLEVADAAELAGAQEIVNVVRTFVEDGEGINMSMQAQAGAALVLACLAYRERLRPLLADRAVPALVHCLQHSSDPGMRYPIAKAVQYLCENNDGRSAAQTAGAVPEFVKMLPPVNPEVDYSDFVFDDFFAFVTVPDTALKALYHLAQNPAARREMVEADVVSAVREMISMTQLSDDTKTKYARKLVELLTTSPEYRLRRLMTLPAEAYRSLRQQPNPPRTVA